MADTQPTVEEVVVSSGSESEGMPGLEPTQGGFEGEPSIPKSKQSRSEKKSRKVVQRLGLKQVPGVIRVTVKKGKSVLFVVNQPDVFKTANDTTFVIFGEAKIEQDAANSALAENVGDFTREAVPDLVPATEATADEGDTEGVSAEHIQLVVDQTSCTRAQAISALKETNGDVVNAIMKLTVA